MLDAAYEFVCAVDMVAVPSSSNRDRFQIGLFQLAMLRCSRLVYDTLRSNAGKSYKKRRMGMKSDKGNMSEHRS